MKKGFSVLIIVLVFLMALAFSGCSNGNNADYEARIIALEDALAEYQFRIEDLETELASVKSNSSNLTKRTESSIEEIKTSVKALDGEVKQFKDLVSADIEVNLADQYYLVVGDTFQLFYRSVIKAVNPYGYYIKLSGDKGHAYNRYYEFTPTNNGTFNLTIEVCDSNGNVLGKDSTKLIVNANKTTTEKTILCIGDSLTANGQWIARGVSKYKTAGGKATTVGTISATLSSSAIATGSSVTVNYEGRSGWQWSSYTKGYTTETPSPFVGTNGLSIKDYLTKNNLATPTEVYIFMTFNGFTSTSTYDFSSAFLTEAKKLVDKIHEDLPNAKITLFGLPLTSTYAGLGAYYDINLAYSDNYGVHARIHSYDNFLEEWSKMDEYKGFLRYIDVKGQFDSEYNMPSESKKVNNTNSATEPVGNAMGMHPSSNGYNQIGDAFYRALMSNWGN